MCVVGRYIQIHRAFGFTADGSLNVSGLFAFDGSHQHTPIAGTVAPCAGDHHDWPAAVDFSALGRNTFARTEGPGAGIIEIDFGADVRITRIVVWNSNDTQQSALRLIGCRLCVVGADFSERFAHTFYTADSYFDFDLSAASN